MRPVLLALSLAVPGQAQLPLGSAQVDVTPGGPIRLSGYGSRSDESDGVEQRLKATALAIGEPPVLVIAVDNCGVPAAVRTRVAAGLAQRTGLTEERLAIAATHTHNAPMLTGMLANLFSSDIPADQQARIDAYTERLVRDLIDVGARAIDARAPGRLGFGRDRATFAANRRSAGGPSDHDVEVLAARSEGGDLRALVVNYACHCTTLGAWDHVCGDWAGYAREALEAAHPGARCLVTIGCGADQNPSPRGSLEQAQRYGRDLAAAAGRVLAGDMRAVAAAPTVGRVALELAFDALPDRAGWEARATQGGAVGYHARKNLARLERGEALPTSVDYPVQVLRFGQDLAWAFLPGEVVVDYSLRLKRELDPARLIVTAYANDVPGYVPSERVLREGGYEGGGAMVYYDLPTRYAPGLEQRIVDAVRSLVPPPLVRALPGDRSRSDGFAPLTPEVSAREIEVRAGLRVVLAAAEPLVVDPITIDFGPDGELWVVEMRDYPNPGAGVPSGRVKRLVDDDADGVFDRATVFLDGLTLPTDVKVWRDGVLVCAAPDVLFARDTDGDGVADEVATKLTGFATHNHQARVNSLRWGLDGWLYGANGLFGGTITSDAGTTLELGGQDFRWRPDTGELEHATGLSQQGRCRDDLGRWFGCDNGHLVWHYPLDAALIASAPELVPPPTRVDVCAGEEGAVVFPISPPVRGFVRPDSASGRVTSACGLDVYRDTLLGEDLYGDLFVCEPSYNLVRRVVLEPQGLTFRGRRAPEEQAREFLASRDPWFRPVQVRSGPDGALWVVDMARFIIEHPNFIPAEVLARYDVRAGEDLGRIWRVVPAGDAAAPTATDPRATEDERRLAAALQSDNPELVWWLVDDEDPYVRFSARARALQDPARHLDHDLGVDPDLTADLLARALRQGAEAASLALLTRPGHHAAVAWLRGMDRADMTLDELTPATREQAIARMHGLRHLGLPVTAPLADRLAAVETLGRVPGLLEEDRRVLPELLRPTHPPALRTAALDAAQRSRELLEVALAQRSRLLPADRERLDSLVSDRRPEPTAPGPQAAAELARLATVDSLAGDPLRGREHFQALCATCHLVDGVGAQIAPDLDALTDRSTSGLLTALVDPSRDFLAPYQDYALATTDGRVLGGMVVDETGTSLRIRSSDGHTSAVRRLEIEELRATGRSFMPEALLADRSAQDVADLLAFLRAPRTPPKRFDGNQPTPVRADAHGEWHLAAWNAAIHGPELAYEVPTRNLGYWHTAQDFARWTVVVDQPTEVDVWVEWACQDASAGENFVLSGAGATLRGEVAGTGPDWSRYVRQRAGVLTLPAGEHRFECRPAADPARSLFDLRRFVLVPAGRSPRDGQ